MLVYKKQSQGNTVKAVKVAQKKITDVWITKDFVDSKFSQDVDISNPSPTPESHPCVKIPFWSKSPVAASQPVIKSAVSPTETSSPHSPPL